MSAGSEPEAKLHAFEALVAKWAEKLDLVAPGDLRRFRQRHIDDCLRLLPLLAALPAGPCVDVGSGAGLPGIVLAVADPQRLWRLLEPRLRRVGFLEEVVRDLDLDNVVVFPVTAQAAAATPELGARHVLAVARALAPPEKSFTMLRPLLSAEGTAAVFVGKTAGLPPGATEWEPGIAVSGRLETREGLL